MPQPYKNRTFAGPRLDGNLQDLISSKRLFARYNYLYSPFYNSQPAKVRDAHPFLTSRSLLQIAPASQYPYSTYGDPCVAAYKKPTGSGNLAS